MRVEYAVLIGLFLMAAPMWPWPGVDERLSMTQECLLRFTMFGIGIGFLGGLVVGARLS